MNNKPWFPAIATIVLAACAEAPQPVSVEQQFVENVVAALGGKEAIESANTLMMEAEGRMLNLGQDMTPESASLAFDISDYRLFADLANGSSRTELTRTPLFDYFRGREPMRLVSGFDGSIAYDVGPDGSARRAHDDVAADRRSNYYHHPLPLLRAVLLNGATAGNVRNEEGLDLADIATVDGEILTIAVDSSTNRPVFIRSTDYHSYLRDVSRKTGFSGYTTVGMLTLPSVVEQSLDEFHLFRIEVTSQALNSDIGDISAPAEAASAPPVSGAAPANVSAEDLGDGVWLLAGESHHSVLIEFSDHLMIVEAPNEVRTLAVIATAEELVPGKPVTKVVNTHHHFDHSGGIRAAVANGLTVITQSANEAFYRRMAEQSSTIATDALAADPRAIEIEAVEASATYEDESQKVEIYHVAGSPHSSSILMVYLPQQRLLIEADLYNPGRTTPQLFAPNLLDNVRQYGLEVDRIVPIHGGVVGFDALEADVLALQSL
jgi:glyoxylase-like metal-dependent hydrolase (beta-lactamase superfamily II)